QPANGWPNGNPWTTDPAHMPDLNYVPYLTTGSHYQLELLQAEGDFAISAVLWSGSQIYDGVPLGIGASFSNGNQARGIAWELRQVAEAAYLTPDNDPMKAYFTNEPN